MSDGWIVLPVGPGNGRALMTSKLPPSGAVVNNGNGSDGSPCRIEKANESGVVPWMVMGVWTLSVKLKSWPGVNCW